MSERVQQASEALHRLNAATMLLRLYGPDHAAVRAHAEAGARAMQRLEHGGRSIVITLAGRHGVCDGQMLACSQDVMSGIGAMLLARGANRIVLEPTLTAAALLSMAQRLQDPGHSLSSDGIPGITIGSATVQGQEAGGVDVDLLGEALCDDVPASERAVEITSIWNRVVGSGKVPAQALGELAGSIAAVATTHTDAMLALSKIKSNDEYTYVHTVNVALMSSALAQACGLAATDVHDLTIAAIMHDIGKTRIPEAILNKPGKLDDAELLIMRSHPVEGARLLLEMPELPDIAAIVAYEHHIVLDGSGYPRVGTGYRTHLASRIVQIADIFDALRTHRPYRAALPLAEVQAIMARDVGRRIDADLLRVFFDRVVSRTVAETASTQAA